MRLTSRSKVRNTLSPKSAESAFGTAISSSGRLFSSSARRRETLSTTLNSDYYVWHCVLQTYFGKQFRLEWRHAMTDPRVSRGASFHDGLAESWNVCHERGGFKKRLAFFRKLISPLILPGQYWLDAGCGGGILTLELSKLGARGLAIDGSGEMINAAVRDVMPLSGGFSFERVASISSIDVPGASFDGVLCSSVLEYVDHIDETLSEFNRVLRVGGKLVLSVPNKYSLIRRLQKLVRYAGLWICLDLFPYLGVSKNDFSSVDLARRLEKYGFLVLSLEGFDPILPKTLSRIVPALYFIVAKKASPEAQPE